MSTEQPFDPELIEQTKQQIQLLVREIQQLSRSDRSPAEFFPEFLNRVVQALAAMGGAVWMPADDGRLSLTCQINLQKTGLIESESAQQRHGRLLYNVMNNGEAVIVPPQSGGGDEEAGNPTEFLLVLCALHTDKEARGVVEVFQRANTAPRTQRGFLTFLKEMCELANGFLKTRALRQLGDRQVMWTQLENFTRMAHASLDVKETAYTIANEGRRLIECDRVSIAINKGRKCTIEAISGQDVFDKRSNAVTMLGRLATAVAATGEPMWYTGDTKDMAPQVEDAVQAYVDESHSKTVAVLPLIRPRDAERNETDPDAPHERPEPIGALIVEQIEDSRLRDGMLQRVEVVCQHSSSALANALEYHGLFLLPVWQTLGKASFIVKARTLPKTLAITAAILAVTLGLVLIPWDFELSGEGALQPRIRQDVFANVDGNIAEVLVKHDDPVKQGQKLVDMESTDLDVEIERVRGDWASTAKRREAARRALIENRDLKQSEKDQINAETRQLEELEKSYAEQLTLLETKKQMLNVTSPIDGRVTTSWDVLEQLTERPVHWGQVLMRIADPDQDWVLEVRMPEDRMGHISEARQELGPDLRVRYKLATQPEVSHEGTIEDVDYSAEVRGEEGNTVLIRVKIDKQEIAELLRPGAGVTARVYCGRRSVGYCLFHDVWAWIHSNVFFRFLP